MWCKRHSRRGMRSLRATRCVDREVFGIMQQDMWVLIHGQLTRTIVEGGVTTAPSVLVYHMFVYAPGYL